MKKNQNVEVIEMEATQMETEGMYERFCTRCGKKFKTDSKRASICPECKEKIAEENKAKMRENNRERALRLGLVNINLYAEEKAKIKEFADAHKMTIPDAIREMLK